MIKMMVLSSRIFPSYNIPATYNSNGSLTQQPRSLSSAGAIAATRRDVVKRFPQLSLATMASFPLSWAKVRVTQAVAPSLGVWASKSPELRISGMVSKISSKVKDTLQGIHCNIHGSMTAEERFKERIKAKEKTAKFLIYVQDHLGGPNATVWDVARAAQTANSPTAFGVVRVVDDLLTAEADPNSEKLGRTQGIITNSDMSKYALTMDLTFYFTGGQYKGSSITIGGRNPINDKDREMPIVGGTGIFRMARGYVISNTHSFDNATKYGVLEYTFFVAYPDQQEI